jgi:predicted O-methyltransferase YrrM
MNKGALEDRHCQNDVESLVKKHNIKRIIETGSFKGWSTKILATFCDKVDTIEINSEYIAEAVEHLKETNNVTIHKGSSPDVMKNIISYDEKNLLVFLDAHWDDYWPVNDELKVLYEKNVQPVICIHDFFVPGGDLIKDYSNNASYNPGQGSKFGYDQYRGKALDLNFILKELNLIYTNGFDYHYSNEVDEVDSGLIYIYPKENANI